MAQCSISHKREWNNAICSNMNGPKDYHTEWSKSEVSQRKTNIIWYHSYVEYKKMIQMNLFIKQQQTHRYRK